MEAEVDLLLLTLILITSVVNITVTSSQGMSIDVDRTSRLYFNDGNTTAFLTCLCDNTVCDIQLTQAYNGTYTVISTVGVMGNRSAFNSNTFVCFRLSSERASCFVAAPDFHLRAGNIWCSVSYKSSCHVILALLTNEIHGSNSTCNNSGSISFNTPKSSANIDAFKITTTLKVPASNNSKNTVTLETSVVPRRSTATTSMAEYKSPSYVSLIICMFFALVIVLLSYSVILLVLILRRKRRNELRKNHTFLHKHQEYDSVSVVTAYNTVERKKTDTKRRDYITAWI